MYISQFMLWIVRLVAAEKMNFKSTNIGIMSPVNQNSITPRMSGTARRTLNFVLAAGVFPKAKRKLYFRFEHH
jgi:hypothetical protein